MSRRFSVAQGCVNRRPLVRVCECALRFLALVLFYYISKMRDEIIRHHRSSTTLHTLTVSCWEIAHFQNNAAQLRIPQATMLSDVRRFQKVLHTAMSSRM